MRFVEVLFVSSLLAIACTKASDEGDSGETGDTEPIVIPLENPYITEGTVTCGIVEAGGEDPTIWFFNLQANDAQGADTISAFPNYIQVYLGEQEVLNEDVVVCSSDGTCSGSFKEADFGIECANSNAYEFRAIVLDEDGHESEPYVLEFTPYTGTTG